MKPLLPKLALFALMYAFILTILTLCWVGAEYVFEGAVTAAKLTVGLPACFPTI